MTGSTGTTIASKERKYTEIQVLARRDWIMDELLKMTQRAEIKKQWKSKYPDLSDPSFNNDLVVVYERMREALPSAEQIVVDHLGKYNNIYNLCIENGDHKTAMNALKEIERLYQVADQRGIHNVNKLVIKNTMTLNTENLSLDQIKQLLNKGDNTDNPLIINHAHNYKGINIVQEPANTDTIKPEIDNGIQDAELTTE